MSTRLPPDEKAEVFFGDDTPWFCAACGEEMYRGGLIIEESMLIDGREITIHVHSRCARDLAVPRPELGGFLERRAQMLADIDAADEDD